MKRINNFKNIGNRLAIALIMGSALLVVACGDLEEVDTEDWSSEVVVSEHDDALRARLSKLCDCPPRTRVFYSPSFEPNCDWVCGKLVSVKRIACGTAHDPDGGTPTIAKDEDGATDPDGETPQIAKDEDGVMDADGGTPTMTVAGRDGESHECTDDDITAGRRTIESGLCISVCPDGSIVGPHPCSEIAECLQRLNDDVDTSSGTSSEPDRRPADDARKPTPKRSGKGS